MNDIILHVFPSFWGVPNGSPPCMKLETYLRMAGVRYQIKTIINPKKAPNCKVPYVEIGGHVISDSEKIIKYIESKLSSPSGVNSHDAYSLAMGRAITIMLENHCYWVMVWGRWVDPKGALGWKKTCMSLSAVAEKPWIVKKLLWKVMTRRAVRELYEIGIGRLAVDDIYKTGKDDIDAVSSLLGQKNFIFGESPHFVDAVIYAQIANLIYQPWHSPIKLHILSEHKNLINHTKRMGEKYFPELKPSIEYDSK